MRLAILTTVLLTLALGAAGAAGDAVWTPAHVVATCAPARSPKVVFPSSLPQHRSGHGAILWLGGTPECNGAAAAGTTLDGVSLHSDDRLSRPQALWHGSGLAGPLQAATTTSGQLVATVGDGDDAAYGELDAGTRLAGLRALGGAASQVATADGYIGDADIVNVTRADGVQTIALREQRHYQDAFAAPVSFTIAASRVAAIAVAMDFRGDSVILWSQSGTLYARWISNSKQLGATQTVGPTGYEPQIAASLSDNNHAFVMWTDEPAPGVSGATQIYLDHSREGVTFGAPRLLSSFVEPTWQRLTPGSLGLERISPSEGVIAAWTTFEDGDYVVCGAGLTSGGPLPPSTVAQPGIDLRLAAIAAGPRNDVVLVLESAPRAAHGFDTTSQSVLATRSVAGGPGGTAFETPVTLADPGPNSNPSAAFDPDTDRAVVAWQTLVAGTPSVAYAVRDAP